MAFDIFFQSETDDNWARSPSVPRPPKPAPLPLEFSPTEGKTLKLLEPSTASFVVALLSWARGQGIPARLTATAIYTPEQSVAYKEAGKSGVSPGLDWHNVGRAFHLGIFLPDKTYDFDAYAKVGAKARELGGEWLGDKPLAVKKDGKKYIIYDTAHFEYHPMFDLGTYRKTPLAQVEFQKAQARARRYA
jgi:hypothetical protein